MNAKWSTGCKHIVVVTKSSTYFTSDIEIYFTKERGQYRDRDHSVQREIHRHDLTSLLVDLQVLIVHVYLFLN